MYVNINKKDIRKKEKQQKSKLKLRRRVGARLSLDWASIIFGSRPVLA